jgi:transcription elongation GreA/GreB family factor
MTKQEIKNELIRICEKELIAKIEMHEKAMEEAQKEANYHKGAMESRYDTFKEDAQEKRNSHAKKIAETTKILSSLNSIKNLPVNNKVSFGSVVEAHPISYFIFVYVFMKPVEIDGKQFLPINLLSPLGQKLATKKKGDKVEFNNKKIEILDVY